MRGPDHLTPGAARPKASGVRIAVAPLFALILAACSASGQAGGGFAVPSHSVSPTPNYPAVCAPLGADSSATCVRITLGAIDDARAQEGLRPLVLPSAFSTLTVAEQLFVVIDRERVDRGLAPIAGLTAPLDANAQKGADGAGLPPRLGPAYTSTRFEWIGAVDNGLDADFQWLYDDGPDSGVPGCTQNRTAGCWADRRVFLGRFGSRHVVMGAAFDPTGDTSRGDRGGSSLAATLAVDTVRPNGYAYTWKDALTATAAGTLRPLRSIPASESNTGIRDPSHNVVPVPDFTRVCTDGLDDSPACINAVLAAIDRARRLEGVRPMVLPPGFARLSMPEQLFVALNLERVDRGLPAFTGLTAGLNQNAQRGADSAGDPPGAGPSYLLDDAEWAGGSSNGLDAVYGWMYDDGFDSGNLDCVRRDAAGCWGHRKGILDDFGSGTNLVMGAAVDASSDTHSGDSGGTSMAVTLAVADAPARSFTYSWSQARAGLQPGAP